MKCVVCEEPGTFALYDREAPAPKTGEVIVNIGRVGICGTDFHAYRGQQPFFEYPRILGHELAGTREDTGEAVTVVPYLHCGQCRPCRTGRTNCCSSLNVIGVHSDGGMCEQIRVPEENVIAAPDLGLDALATVECLSIGAHGVRRSNLSEGEIALVVGAGPIGVGAINFAKIAGAKVIAMDLAPHRLEYCRNVLGLKHVIDASDDPKSQLEAITGGDFPDKVFEATGNPNSMESVFDLLGHGSTLVYLSIVKGRISFDDPGFHARELSVLSSRNATREDFEHVIESLRAGKIDVEAFVTHRADLADLPEWFDRWLDPAAGVMKAMASL